MSRIVVLFKNVATPIMLICICVTSTLIIANLENDILHQQHVIEELYLSDNIECVLVSREANEALDFRIVNRVLETEPIKKCKLTAIGFGEICINDEYISCGIYYTTDVEHALHILNAAIDSENPYDFSHTRIEEGDCIINSVFLDELGVEIGDTLNFNIEEGIYAREEESEQEEEVDEDIYESEESGEPEVNIEDDIYASEELSVQEVKIGGVFTQQMDSGESRSVILPFDLNFDGDVGALKYNNMMMRYDCRFVFDREYNRDIAKWMEVIRKSAGEKWTVWNSGEEIISAAKAFERNIKVKRVVLYGVAIAGVILPVILMLIMCKQASYDIMVRRLIGEMQSRIFVSYGSHFLGITGIAALISYMIAALNGATFARQIVLVVFIISNVIALIRIAIISRTNMITMLQRRE